MVAAMTHYVNSNLIKNYTSRFNTHKRSELRTIYNSIVKLNQQSPLYMFDLSFENQLYALNVKDSAIGLSNSIDAFSLNTLQDSVFLSKKAESSDPSIADLHIISDDYNNLPEPFSLKVDRLATHQINIGNSCVSTNNSLPAGTYKFRLATEDSSQDFSIKIKDKTHNQDAIKQIAGILNKADIGIVATVSSDSNKETSKLILKSQHTGTTNSLVFSLKDISSPSSSRSIVEYFGLDNVYQLPSNSVFEINSEKKESLSNTFTYHRSIKLDLLSESTESADVYYVPDSERIVAELGNFVASYNSIIDTISENLNSQKRASLLSVSVIELSKQYESTLESCGMFINSDNTLSIDPSLAYIAAKEGDIEKFFTTDNEFISRLKNRLERIMIDPMNYLDKTIVTYPNYQKFSFPNPYITSMYSGMLYNFYC